MGTLQTVSESANAPILTVLHGDGIRPISAVR